MYGPAFWENLGLQSRGGHKQVAERKGESMSASHTSVCMIFDCIMTARLSGLATEQTHVMDCQSTLYKLTTQVQLELYTYTLYIERVCSVSCVLHVYMCRWASYRIPGHIRSTGHARLVSTMCQNKKWRHNYKRGVLV